MLHRPSKSILPGIVVALLLMTMPVYAVRDFKISNYGGGHQVWFEAENYDERNPDTEQYFPVVDEADAFGQAITRAGGAGGRISWTFNIAAAGGTGGTWYFWGRVINPSNNSDYMLVEGDPDDAQIPTGPTFPGGNGTAPFSNGDDRIFEENNGGPGNWEWGRSGHQEGHTKELQDGLNTMHIFHRQGNSSKIMDVFVWTDDPDYVPTDEDYQKAIPGGGFGPASSPDPEDGAMLTDTWVSMGWRPGDFAVSHDVYFGESFDDVNGGAADTFRGNQGDAFFVVGFPGFPFPDGLVPGTTYYWRVDEVNDADPNSPWRGPVWSVWIPPTKAYGPAPADGAEFIAPDAELSWAEGFGAKLHTVFFGDNSDDVENAVAGLPQAGTTFAPGTLDLERTYYWRVDEFDGLATHKGDVWSFTTLPDIPVTDPNLVGWYKFEAGSGTKVVDFSGHANFGDIIGDVLWVPGQFNLALEFLGDNFGHVELPAGMVNTASGSILMWVRTDLTDDEGMFWYGTETSGDGFGGENEIHIHIDDPGVLGFAMEGPTDVRLDGPQLAGTGWNHVAATWDQVDGCRLYFNGAEVAFQAYTANIADLTVIRLGRPVATGNGNRYFDGLMDDVRLFDHAISADQVLEIMSKGEDPLKAGSPDPGNGALVDIGDATPLSWSAGEKAAEHGVYFGTDKDAVADVNASDTTGVYRGSQSTTTYTPPEGVEWGGGPYYWRIDENNNDGTISEGSIWSFSVADFIPVEGFEIYTDNDADNEAIWQHWIDGFGVPTNGSQAGYVMPPYAEQTIVHGGRQSMPLFYENTGGVTNSEAALTLTTQRDWTKHGVGELSIWFQGQAASGGSFTEGPVGAFTITSRSGDIWGVDDEFHYGYRMLTGVGSIVARIDSVVNTAAWTKCGVMIRETLEPGSKFAAVYVMAPNADGTPTQGTRFQARTDTDGSATSDTSVATQEQRDVVPPYWVKLEREVTGTFRGYYSSNGTNWTPMTWNPQSISMETSVYVGLALTSNNTNAVAEAKISNVTITGTVSPTWMNQDIGIAANAAEPLYVAVSNATGAPAVVAHPDPAAANITTWTEWVIALQAFADKGINLSNVDKIAIGLGTTGGAAAGGSGVMYFDDIRLYRPRDASGQ